MKFLYFCLVKNLEKIKTNYFPQLTAIFFISLAQSFNLILAFELVKKENLVNITFETEITLGTAIYIMLFIFNMIILKKSDKTITDKFDAVSKNKCVLGTILALIYIAGSIILTVSLAQ